MSASAPAAGPQPEHEMEDTVTLAGSHPQGRLDPHAARPALQSARGLELLFRCRAPRALMNPAAASVTSLASISRA